MVCVWRVLKDHLVPNPVIYFLASWFWFVWGFLTDIHSPCGKSDNHLQVERTGLIEQFWYSANCLKFRQRSVNYLDLPDWSINFRSPWLHFSGTSNYFSIVIWCYQGMSKSKTPHTGFGGFLEIMQEQTREVDRGQQTQQKNKEEEKLKSSSGWD